MSRKLRHLDLLEQDWKDCTACPELAARRTKVVHWRGNPAARLAVVGEAPGEEEDRAGLPFVGASGKRLDALLRQAGLDPAEDVFVCNLLACRPPGNRRPEPAELSACAPRLHWMLGQIVKPKALLLLGMTAAKLAGVHGGLVSQRGLERSVEIVTREGRQYQWPAVITYHPSFLLRNGDKNNATCVGDIRFAYMIAQKD